MTDDQQLEELEGQLMGWTIAGISPTSRPEGVFTLTLSRDGAIKAVEIYATDLGWWTDQPRVPGQHDWLAGPPRGICAVCGYTRDHPDVPEACPGEP